MMGKWNFKNETGCYVELRNGSTIVCNWDLRGRSTPPSVAVRPELLRILNAHEPMLAALKEIAKGEGAFARESLKHASNTIEYMIDVAKAALAAAKGGA